MPELGHAAGALDASGPGGVSMPGMDPMLTVADIVAADLEDKIQANFREYATSQGVPSDYRPLTVRLERDGVLLGGLVGSTIRGWLYVENFALPAAERGTGLGRRILALAEAEAVRRGCTGAFLMTVQFQAPGFYERLGYQAFARLSGQEPRFDRIWYGKRFAG